MNPVNDESSVSSEWWIQCIQWMMNPVNPVSPVNDESDAILLSRWVNCFQWWFQLKHEIQMEVSRPIPGRKFRRKGHPPVQGLRTRLQERIA